MNHLLDTCVLSEWVRPAPSARVVAWLDAQVEGTLFISELSLAELERGILKLQAGDARRARRLATWLHALEQRFADRTLALDRSTLRLWSQLSAQADIAGQRMASFDGLLMATAQRHGLVIVTRNVSDFARYGQVLNPWVAGTD